MGTATNCALCIGFLLSGTISTSACQFLVYQGAAETASMLIPFFNYLGLVVTGIIYACRRRQTLSASTPKLANGPNPPTAPLNSTNCGTPTAVALSILDGQAEYDLESVMGSPEMSSAASATAKYDETATQLSRSRRCSTTSVEVSAETSNSVDIHTDKTSIDTMASPLKPTSTLQLGPFRLTETAFTILVTVLDVVGLVFMVLAIKFAGSGLFEVAYSSIVAWSAFLSRCLLGKRPMKLEMIGIAIVILGLVSNAVAEVLRSGVTATTLDIVIGSALSAASAFVYAISFVVSEAIMSSPNPPDSQRIASMMGIFATIACGIYVLCVTIPNYDAFVKTPIQDAGGDAVSIIVMYAVMMLAQVVHIVLYFSIVGRVGAMTTGILGGLRSAVLFFASAAMFCSNQESQCLTATRAVSACTVICGVLLYSLAQPEPVLEQSFSSSQRSLSIDAKVGDDVTQAQPRMQSSDRPQLSIQPVPASFTAVAAEPVHGLLLSPLGHILVSKRQTVQVATPHTATVSF